MELSVWRTGQLLLLRKLDRTHRCMFGYSDNELEFGEFSQPAIAVFVLPCIFYLSILYSSIYYVHMLLLYIHNSPLLRAIKAF